jgi:hypothetical protein
MWWKNCFLQKLFEFCFLPKFQKPSGPPSTWEIHAPGQDTMQFLSSFLVL